METNFFSQIAQLHIDGQLQLTITKGIGANLVVAVMLHNEHCGDDAKNLIAPFILRETAESLDGGFFQTIASPIEQTSTLLASMEKYLKQLEEAKKQSAMEKEKADAAKKAREARDKKYHLALAQVDELAKEGRHREAWMKLPNLADYPDQKEAIRRRSTELSAKFSPDLFAPPEPQSAAPPQDRDALFPDHFTSGIDEQQDDYNQEEETEDY